MSVARTTRRPRPGRFAAQGQDLRRSPPFTVKGRPAHPVVTSRPLPVPSTIPIEDLSGRSHSVSDTEGRATSDFRSTRQNAADSARAALALLIPSTATPPQAKTPPSARRATVSAFAEDRLNAERAGVVVAARQQKWLQRGATIGVAQLRLKRQRRRRRRRAALVLAAGRASVSASPNGPAGHLHAEPAPFWRNTGADALSRPRPALVRARPKVFRGPRSANPRSVSDLLQPRPLAIESGRQLWRTNSVHLDLQTSV